MADRIYKAELATINSSNFMEAAKGFNKPTSGGLIPFDELVTTLKQVQDCLKQTTVSVYEDCVWVHDERDVWIKIDRDGTIEIGEAGQ